MMKMNDLSQQQRGKSICQWGAQSPHLGGSSEGEEKKRETAAPTGGQHRENESRSGNYMSSTKKSKAAVMTMRRGPTLKEGRVF